LERMCKTLPRLQSWLMIQSSGNQSSRSTMAPKCWFTFSDYERSAEHSEQWLNYLRTQVHRRLNAHRQSNKRRAKIAILDAALDVNEVLDKDVLKFATWEQLKGTRSFTNDTKSDSERFFTSSTAAVLLNVSPNAELYIAHVSSSNAEVKVDAITDVSRKSSHARSGFAHKFCRQSSGQPQSGKLISLWCRSVSNTRWFQ
jgi:hypothetical protein